MKPWLTLGGLFIAGTVLGYWAVFTYRFFEDILPHGGMW
jgi:hypothetical protein